MDSKKHFISTESPLSAALAQLNTLGSELTLFVLDNDDILRGTITDGDLRRGMLKGVQLIDPVESIMNTSFMYLKADSYQIEDLKPIKEKLIKMVPIVDGTGRILKLVNLQKVRTILPIDVVIMAGGEGRRLRPMTITTPKPLLKVGDKPILEHNVDRLCEFGIEKYFITIKYLGNQIREYFGDGSNKGIQIQYTEEKSEPLGTIGAVSMIEEFSHDTVLIMNSDILTNIDYEDFYLDFKHKDADLAVATIPYQVKIPYAVLETEKETIVGFKEKPTYTYYSNGGIYLFKKDVLQKIPKGVPHNATDLMEQLIEMGKRVITYPLHCYWLDIGKPEDFEKAAEDIQHIKF